MSNNGLLSRVVPPSEPTDNQAHTSLSGRLERLTSQATGKPTDTATDGAKGHPSAMTVRLRIAERTRGKSLSTPALSSSPEMRDEPGLARLLGGVLIAPGLIRVITTLAVATKHGAAAVQPPAQEALRYFGGDLTTPIVAIDTETTGLASGTGTVPFLIGLASGDGHGLVITQYLMTAFKGEAPMLSAMATALEAENASILSYNGKPFDIPLLRDRLRMHRMNDLFAKRPHLDLLPAVRRAYSGHWPRCSLSRAERELLGFARTGDIPGSEIPSVWFHWLRAGGTGRLAQVLTHNRADLVSLYLLPDALFHAVHAPALTGAAGTAGAEEHLRQGEVEKALRHLMAHAATLEERGKRLLARLAERHGERALALNIWHEMAMRDDPEALMRLSVHYEHRRRDVHAALSFCERLILATRESSVRKRAEHAHRHARLLRKADAESTSAKPSLGGGGERQAALG